MLNPASSWLAKFAELRASAALLPRFGLAACVVMATAALAAFLVLKSGLIFDSPLDESRACILAMEYTRTHGMTPVGCDRFYATDSVASIYVKDKNDSWSRTINFSGGAFPFEQWHVDGARQHPTQAGPSAGGPSNAAARAGSKAEILRAVQHDDED